MTALGHIVLANVFAMQAVIAVRPDANFIQSQSSEQYHPENPAAVRAAGHLNAVVFEWSLVLPTQRVCQQVPLLSPRLCRTLRLKRSSPAIARHLRGVKPGMRGVPRLGTPSIRTEISKERHP